MLYMSVHTLKLPVGALYSRLSLETASFTNFFAVCQLERMADQVTHCVLMGRI